MSTIMSRRRILWFLPFLTYLGHAQDTVPIATNPILSTATVATVLPSLVTVYSVVPASDDANAVSTVTTTIDGQATVLTTAAGVIAGSSTSTIISTISVTTSQVVVSTIGYSTIYGPGSNQATTASAPETTPAATLVPSAPAPVSTGTESSSTVNSPSSSEATSAATSHVSSTSSSSTSPAASSNASDSADGPSQSRSKGLSTGAKAGIGVGVALGVLLLAGAFFVLGQRFSRQRQQTFNHDDYDPNATSAPGVDVFQAGKPYESTGSGQVPGGMLAAKSHRYSRATTEVGSESISGKSSELPGRGSLHEQRPTNEISALPQMGDDEPMYVGVPSHMSGSKRWSMKEYKK